MKNNSASVKRGTDSAHMPVFYRAPGAAKHERKSARSRTCESAGLSEADGLPVGPSRKEGWEGSAAMKQSPVVEATRGWAFSNGCHFFLKSKTRPAPWLRRRVALPFLCFYMCWCLRFNGGMDSIEKNQSSIKT